MSLAELRCFDAVARTGSFSAAAELLLRSQPTVTIQVAQLERNYGVELFHRHRGKKVVVTEFGLRLSEITRRLFSLEEDALELLKNGGNLKTGHLRIGASAPYLATRYIPRFKSRYPGIHISLDLGNSESVYRDVRECKVDIGFLGGSGGFEDCNVWMLSRPEIVLLAAAGSEAAGRREIDRSEFARETVLLREKGSETRELFMSRTTSAGFLPGATIEIGSREGVCAAAAAGLGMAIISLEEIQQGPATSIVRLKGLPIFGQTQIICLKDRHNSELIRAFLAGVVAEAN